jgi:hypothetical protein
VRDLTVSPDATPGPGWIELLVYDTYSGEQLAWDDETVQLHVCDLDVVLE